MTAANTDDEVTELVEVLEELAGSDLLRLRES
jgi:hypothetical protein